MNLNPISQTAAFDSVTQIGRQIAKRKFEDAFWRKTAIDVLVQALEVLPVGPQFSKAREYLHAIQEYDELEERGWDALDLVRRPEFLLSPSMAYRLARKDEPVKAISFEILEKLSRGFGVAVEDLWTWEASG